jgi:hypothetical protein
LDFKEYCVRFASPIRHSLGFWYEACGSDDQRKLIRRNLDRECNRSDIDEGVLESFFLRLSNNLPTEDEVRLGAYYRWIVRGCPFGSPEEDWLSAEEVSRRRVIARPLQIINEIFRSDRGDFILKGYPVSPRGHYLCRYMKLEDFVQYNTTRPDLVQLNDDGVQDLSRYAILIRLGRLTGSHMENTFFGDPDHPVWCTTDAYAAETDADRVRNDLGLLHMTGGYIVEVKYPSDLSGSLRAPTVLDASSRGADNWIL